MKKALIILAVLLAGTAAAQGQEITAKSWNSHPEILAVRALVADIESGIKKNAFTRVKREQEYEQPGKDTQREAWSEKESGLVRKLVRSHGSDDSAVTLNEYYDAAGRLRFVFIQGGAVNGTAIEQRIYYNKYGDRIWEMQKTLKGPGYTFPKEWPDSDLDYNAASVSLTEW